MCAPSWNNHHPFTHAIYDMNTIHCLYLPVHFLEFLRDHSSKPELVNLVNFNMEAVILRLRHGTGFWFGTNVQISFWSRGTKGQS